LLIFTIFILKQESTFALSLSINMTVYALKTIKHFIHTSLRNLPIEIITIQQVLTNSLVNKTQIVQFMAQPYEIIDVTNVDNQQGTKPDG
jgi:hypothetical protein